MKVLSILPTLFFMAVAVNAVAINMTPDSVNTVAAADAAATPAATLEGCDERCSAREGRCDRHDEHSRRECEREFGEQTHS